MDEHALTVDNGKVVITGAGRVQALVGRETELEAVAKLLSARAEDATCLVLEGPAGIGKTSVWLAAVTRARERGLSVLATRPSGADAQLGFAGLGDLFEGIETTAMKALPAPQRRALESALLLRVKDEPTDARAVAAGVLGVLRTLAARGDVLVAIDDVQWLDSASAAALAFAVRRLRTERSRFLLARRTEWQDSWPTPLENALSPDSIERVRVMPLTFGATCRVLHERLDVTLPRQAARRVFDAAQGNPLFSLELARAIARGGGRIQLGDDVPLPDTIETALAARVAALRPHVRRALLAVALSSNARAADLAAVVDADSLEDATGDGTLAIDGERVRAAHPLLAAVAKARSSAGERRELHARLAEAATDEEERSLHLALATAGVDPEVATRVGAAAARASRRGAATTAAMLGEHALRLTHTDASEGSQRLLDLADYLFVAGDFERMTELLAPRVESLPAGPVRARGQFLLGEASFSNAREVDRFHDDALAECGADVALRATILVRKAGSTALGLVERLPDAEAWAREAAGLARQLRDGALEHRALGVLAWVLSLRGRPIDEVLARDRELPDAATYLIDAIDRIRAQRHAWRGEVEAAHEILTPLLAVADERGETESYYAVRLNLIELELRVGSFAAAAALLDDWARQREEATGSPASFLRCSALLACGRGRAAEAREAAERAIDAANAVGIEWHRLEAFRARGIAALLANDFAAAAASLGEAWDHTRTQGVNDPGAFPVAPDLVEALSALGSVDEAHAVADVLSQLAEEQRHPWGIATAARCRGLALLAGKDDAGAVAALETAAARYEELGLGFDRARTLVALGVALRRLKRKRDGRSALAEAVRSFDALGCDGWADRASAELARFAGRRATEARLTPTEERVAELVAQGLTNKQVAAALVVSVSAVEANLTRIYAKLGVRSRIELARTRREERESVGVSPLPRRERQP